jgi:DNA-binding transcriptional ArsR family regulator
MKEELSLWDLENRRIYIKVKKNIIRKLFNYAIKLFGTQRELAKFLKKSNGNISNYKRKSLFIPLDVVMKILNRLPEIQREKFKEKISRDLEKIRHGYGTSIPIKITFPIKFSPELANIAGHLAGDGGITKVNRVFYSNKSRTLIELFKRNMRIVFGKIPYNEYREKCTQVMYPTITGVILKFFFGEMRNEQKRVPLQILGSNSIYQSSFIRALFDDEGNVNFKKATVQINMTNKSIIEDVKQMLLNFRIVAGKITQVKRKRIGKKDIYLFRISGREHLKLFMEKIGFDNPIKKIKLQRLVESYKYKKVIYGKGWLTREYIINILKKEGKATKYQIAKELNRNPTALKYHLLKLENNKIITSRRENLMKVYSLVNKRGV